MKYRVIVNGVSFYTTKRQIDSGVGSDTTINLAVSAAMVSMGRSRGIGTTIGVYDGKMQRHDVAVQIDRL